MTEHEKDIKEIRALESISKSLKSIDFYLKQLVNTNDTAELPTASTVVDPTELICPKCGHKGCCIMLGSTYAICPDCRETFDLN